MLLHMEVHSHALLGIKNLLRGWKTSRLQWQLHRSAHTNTLPKKEEKRSRLEACAPAQDLRLVNKPFRFESASKGLNFAFFGWGVLGGDDVGFAGFADAEPK